MSDLYVVVLDGSQPDDSVFTYARDFARETAPDMTHPVSSIRDMVMTLHGRCSRGDRISTLRIEAHGAPAAQRIGRDWLTVRSLPQHAADLRSLHSLFTPRHRPHVVLAGCRVGETDELVRALSMVWPGVSVIAAMMRQATVLMGVDGPYRVCLRSVCGVGENPPDPWSLK